MGRSNRVVAVTIYDAIMCWLIFNEIVLAVPLVMARP